MKNLSLLIAGVLFTASAFAAKVGDQIEFTGSIASGNNTFPSGLTLEVTGLGSKPDTFVVKTTVSVSGQNRSTTAERTAVEIGDEAKAAELVANCAANKGTLEPISITTATAVETIQTCKISGMQDGAVITVNYAAIPFLTARMITSKNGQISTLTVKSYKRGE